MNLLLYTHPLSSYCHKALIAFYENDIPFEQQLLGGPDEMAAFRKLWPIGKFPLLHDRARDHLVPESTTIIEYLAQHYPGEVALVPRDADFARQVRMRDRFFDNYLHSPMQKVAGDRMRPPERRDPLGVEEARAMYRTALDMLERQLGGRTWIMGEAFTMADCAAAPPLNYGEHFFGPLSEIYPNIRAYLARLRARPSYARALREAEPYLHLLPK